MRARDFAEPHHFVTTDDDVTSAARVSAEQSLPVPVLLVLDTDGQPYAAVPGSPVIRRLIPACIAEDPVLACVTGEQHDVELAELAELAERLVGLMAAERAPRRDLLPTVRVLNRTRAVRSPAGREWRTRRGRP